MENRDVNNSFLDYQDTEDLADLVVACAFSPEENFSPNKLQPLPFKVDKRLSLPEKCPIFDVEKNTTTTSDTHTNSLKKVFTQKLKNAIALAESDFDTRLQQHTRSLEIKYTAISAEKDREIIKLQTTLRGLDDYNRDLKERLIVQSSKQTHSHPRVALFRQAFSDLERQHNTNTVAFQREIKKLKLELESSSQLYEFLATEKTQLQQELVNITEINKGLQEEKAAALCAEEKNRQKQREKFNFEIEKIRNQFAGEKVKLENQLAELKSANENLLIKCAAMEKQLAFFKTAKLSCSSAVLDPNTKGNVEADGGSNSDENTVGYGPPKLTENDSAGRTQRRQKRRDTIELERAINSHGNRRDSLWAMQKHKEVLYMEKKHLL